MTEGGPILVAVSPGELIDRITILEIKRERIEDREKRENVIAQLSPLAEIGRRDLPGSPELDGLRRRLKEINAELWDVEDRLRICERDENFGSEFVDLARSVYRLNDRRAASKREIDSLLGAKGSEEKSYLVDGGG